MIGLAEDVDEIRKWIKLGLITVILVGFASKTATLPGGNRIINGYQLSLRGCPGVSAKSIQGKETEFLGNPLASVAEYENKE